MPIPAPCSSPIARGYCCPALCLSPGCLSWKHSSASFPAPLPQREGLCASLCALSPEAPPVVQSKGGLWWREKGRPFKVGPCLDSRSPARFFFPSPELRPPVVQWRASCQQFPVLIGHRWFSLPGPPSLPSVPHGLQFIQLNLPITLSQGLVLDAPARSGQ